MYNADQMKYYDEPDLASVSIFILIEMEWPPKMAVQNCRPFQSTQINI